MTEETQYYGLAFLEQVTFYSVKLFFLFILKHLLCHYWMCYTFMFNHISVPLLSILDSFMVLLYVSRSPGHYPYLTVNSETFPAQTMTISTLIAVY